MGRVLSDLSGVAVWLARSHTGGMLEAEGGEWFKIFYLCRSKVTATLSGWGVGKVISELAAGGCRGPVEDKKTLGNGGR